ncbi:MAG TPA: class I SAM-dependent methyltransferase [Bacteroidetes bacterium]|nr:class I SAM-dependent methyltransferase [Bacteroidota bacterium]HIL56530.1 class I SAM-dependent methyltransferase [Rhodothermales bacterium]
MSHVALRSLLRFASLSSLPEPARSSVRVAGRLRLNPQEAEDERALDAFRQRLAAMDREVPVVDYGAGTGAGEKPPVRRLSEVYRRAATGPAWGRFLYGLARAMRPTRVLELGTNLGVGAATLAMALARTEAEGGPAGRVVTLEGAPAYAEVARQSLAEMGLSERARVVVGAFVDSLPDVLDGEGPFDLVFIDGHHEEAAARTYVHAIRPALSSGALVILDDVEPGRPVRRAWRSLAEEADGSAWLGKYGLLVYR